MANDRQRKWTNDDLMTFAILIHYPLMSATDAQIVIPAIPISEPMPAKHKPSDSDVPYWDE